MDKVLFFRLVLDEVFMLKSKPHVVRKSKIIWPGNIECMGMYYGDKIRDKYKHRIEYYYKTTDENIFATIAHEYVHCWQMENNLELEHDNPSFIAWENYFRKHFDLELQFV